MSHGAPALCPDDRRHRIPLPKDLGNHDRFELSVCWARSSAEAATVCHARPRFDGRGRRTRVRRHGTRVDPEPVALPRRTDRTVTAAGSRPARFHAAVPSMPNRRNRRRGGRVRRGFPGRRFVQAALAEDPTAVRQAQRPFVDRAPPRHHRGHGRRRRRVVHSRWRGRVRLGFPAGQRHRRSGRRLQGQGIRAGHAPVLPTDRQRQGQRQEGRGR